MPIISAFCKKGGVGKTTFVGYYAHYLATKGNNVLVVSIDDQNSIFKIFGEDDKIFDTTDNYLEFLMAGKQDFSDILIEVRENLYLIKTLNTDKLSTRLILERSQEKVIKKIFDTYNDDFDYVFIDFPPSSSRITEVLLDMSDTILIVVGLDSLGLGGFINTIQYFIDNELELGKIKYVLPNLYVKNRRAPKKSIITLGKQSQEFTPKSILLPYFSEKSTVKNLQDKGLTPFDDVPLDRYDLKEKKKIEDELLDIYNHIDLNK